MLRIDEPDHPAWSLLSGYLNTAGYSTAALCAEIGLKESVDALLSNTGRYSLFYSDQLRSARSSDIVLGRLFLFCDYVDEHTFAGLGELSSLLTSLGLVEPVADHLPPSVRATAAITEIGSRYFLSDRLFENDGAQVSIFDHSEICMPPHASSLELLSVLGRPGDGGAAQSFLDVGCGSGCQSIVYSAQCRRASGIDISCRSVKFSRINASINRARVHYAVSSAERFEESQFDMLAFNTPSTNVGLDFIDRDLTRLLKPEGIAHIWMQCELGRSHRTVVDFLRENISKSSVQIVGVECFANSPYALSNQEIRSRRLPPNSLLVSQPSRASEFFDSIHDRGISAVTSAVVSLRAEAAA